jgi:hypothetical protein
MTLWLEEILVDHGAKKKVEAQVLALFSPFTDTVTEDVLLTAAVKLHGEQDNWKNIALSVPGRMNKACTSVSDLHPSDYLLL